MCGIAGIVYFKKQVKQKITEHQKILEALKHRGPDFQNHLVLPQAQFYHSRLVILDPSSESNQPFTDADKNEVLVYNGEIFNYETLRNIAEMRTHGDVEVLYNLFRREGTEGLKKVNGFFAFAFYNQNKHQLTLARDRMGVKPLYYFADDEKLAFASELKPLLEIIGPQELNPDQLYTYFRLNYCAGPESIFKNIFRLPPGYALELDENGLKLRNWFNLERTEQKDNLKELLFDAVSLRLHADVPVGSFLSGGLDSAIVSALAKQIKPDLKTFSIGFKDHPYLDESANAESLARYIKSDHHTFHLTEVDFLKHLPDFFQSIDEPFADSSAFNFYLLSKMSKGFVKVALSGDGADELFKGYNKHRALHLSENGMNRALIKCIAPLSIFAGSSRETFFQNQIRKVKKFNQFIELDPIQKQEFLASISQDNDCEKLFLMPKSELYFKSLFGGSKIYKAFGLEDYFDLQTVLADDMLVKADRFSMQHGLEIRNPFLDYRIVKYALNLPKKEKLTVFEQKIILKQTFGYLLPKETLKRKKKGFELPLRSWLNGALKEQIQTDWLSKTRIEDEKLLNYETVDLLKKKLYSHNPEDSAAQVWAILIFENWYHNFKKYIKTNA